MHVDIVCAICVYLWWWVCVFGLGHGKSVCRAIVFGESMIWICCCVGCVVLGVLLASKPACECIDMLICCSLCWHIYWQTLACVNHIYRQAHTDNDMQSTLHILPHTQHVHTTHHTMWSIHFTLLCIQAHHHNMCANTSLLYSCMLLKLSFVVLLLLGCFAEPKWTSACLYNGVLLLLYVVNVVCADAL